MASVAFVHGVGDPPGPGPDVALAAWIEALCAPLPERFEAWARDNTAMAYYQDWSWFTADPDHRPETESTWTSVRRTFGEVAEEAQAAYDEVRPERFADLAEVAQRWSDSDRVATASNVAADRVSAFNLWQMPAFLENVDETRQVVVDRFTSTIDVDTRVVIAHSMGSVVAFEAAHEHGLELDALITLGSPLGVEGYVRRRLSSPDRVPPGVGRWINIAHLNEPVALINELAPLFAGPDGEERIEDIVLQTKSPWHAIDTYLRHDVVRRAIWDVIEPVMDVS